MIVFSKTIDVCELYVDGSLVSSVASPEDYVASEGPSILINNHMKFDNLRLYNRAINAKEVKEIYNKEK